MGRTIHVEQTVTDALLAELTSIISGERAAVAHRCRERDISMPHLYVMTILDAQGPIPMSRLAELLGSSLPTVTGLVSRMEERRLVRRTHDATDRRVVFVALSSHGASQLKQLSALRQRRLAAALSHLDPAQQDRLLESIKTLRAAFDRTNPSGASA